MGQEVREGADDFIGSAVYCAVITHEGSTKNGFTECQDDTMNVRGKGKHDVYAPRTADEKHAHKHGHKLIDRIDL